MLYVLDNENKQKLNIVKRTNLNSVGWREVDLETLLINNIHRLISENSLMPIFRERKGKEEPDIMALDKLGKLYILELKRWKSDQENLLQVFRYGQIFGQYTYEQLNDLFHKFNLGAEELKHEHSNYFGLRNEEILHESDYNKKQHFLIVTDGTDFKTREAINYWKGHGLDIDALIYRVYLTDSNEKLIEFDTYSPEEDAIEYEECCYILNTNVKLNKNCDAEMLLEKKAAAYYSPWKEKINKIQKGDKVFLYRSGEGIVAMGIGSGNIFKKDYESNKNEEHYSPLDSFVTLTRPLSASDIKSITKVNVIFRQTMFELDKDAGNSIYDFINKNCL